MNRFTFSCLFTIYIAILGVIFSSRIPYGYTWFGPWIFDKFFVYQFMSVITVGLAIAGRSFNNLTYTRMGSRRKILARELLAYYIQGWICVTITFLFIAIGAWILGENHFMPYLTNWYFRYLLGVFLFISLMSCLKWSKHLTARKYAALIVFAWLAIELLVLMPYFTSLIPLDNVNLLFSWIFERGTESYFWLSGLIIIATLLNFKISDKRDFL